MDRPVSRWFGSGMPLVDDYLAFLGGRCRPNTVLAGGVIEPAHDQAAGHVRQQHDAHHHTGESPRTLGYPFALLLMAYVRRGPYPVSMKRSWL